MRQSTIAKASVILVAVLANLTAVALVLNIRATSDPRPPSSAGTRR